jgi:ADP-ribosylglycohydrolase
MKAIDHIERMKRVRMTLDGVRIGDGFGQSFFLPEKERLAMVAAKRLPEAPWYFTDDTVMSVAVAEILDEFGGIDQEALAQLFAKRYAEDPRRAYGGSVQFLLRGIAAGKDWRMMSKKQFDGMGSLGNGGAMRSAVVGAYFAGDLDRTAEQTAKHAEITHAHEEGIDGAVAVALAAGMAASTGDFDLAEIAKYVHLMRRAAGLSLNTESAYAATILGNGIGLRATDTVPLALWMAKKHWGDFESAMWDLVAAGGDRDTTCAIAGGVMAAGGAKIPEKWLEMSEKL